MSHRIFYRINIYLQVDGEKQWDPEDDKNWDLGQKIESIVEQLDTLGSTEAGKT